MSDKPDAWDEADADWQDLQECWKVLRPASPVTLVSNRVSDLKSQLLLVAAKASFDLRQHVKQFDGETLTTDLLATITSKGVELFMQRWFDHLRSQDLAGLVEVVLEGQQLSPEEMKGFLTALPASLLDRIVVASVGTVTGVHALIAFEHHRRISGIRDYTLSKEGQRTKVSFFDPKREVMVDFYLDEAFEGPPKQEDPSEGATK